MITVSYLANFSMGSDLPSQLTAMAFQPLDQGETLMPGLEILSDVTSWNGGQLQRVLTFLETPEFIANVGLPFSDAKRKSMVTGLFSYKIGLFVRKPVTELIALS